MTDDDGLVVALLVLEGVPSGMAPNARRAAFIPLGARSHKARVRTPALKACDGMTRVTLLTKKQLSPTFHDVHA